MSIELTQEQEAQLARYTKGVHFWNDIKMSDGKGGWFSTKDVEREIREGTDFGREALQALMELDLSEEKAE